MDHGQAVEDELIRATGLLAWYALILDVIVGMLMTAGMTRGTFPRARKYQVHRIVGWFMVLAVALHASLTVTMHYHGWGYVDVNDVSWSYTVAHNAGVMAWWLTIVVLVTTLARMLIDRQTWLVLHRTLPFLILVFATVHALYTPHGLTWPVLVPATVALTFVASVGIARWNRNRQRKVGT